jgi:hypothetical protein
MKNQNSELLEINFFDIVKGAVVCLLTAILTSTYQMLTTVPPHFDAKVVAISSITALIAYLIKQLATNSQGQLFKQD